MVKTQVHILCNIFKLVIHQTKYVQLITYINLKNMSVFFLHKAMNRVIANKWIHSELITWGQEALLHPGPYIWASLPKPWKGTKSARHTSVYLPSSEWTLTGNDLEEKGWICYCYREHMDKSSASLVRKYKPKRQWDSTPDPLDCWKQKENNRSWKDLEKLGCSHCWWEWKA